jgi:hypothetical protein
MKFQLKAIAAAVILAAALPAHASLELPNTGNGSTVLVVLDRTANLTATFDLGLHYSDFNQIASAGALGASASAPALNWDLASNPNYAATWSALFSNGATLPNLQYAFLAADNLGAGTGGQGFIASFAGAGAPTQTSAPVGTAAGQLNITLGNIDSVGTLQSNINTSAADGAALNSGVSGVYNVSGKLNNIGNFVFANVGTTMGMSQYVLGATTVSQAGTTIFGNGAQLQLLSNGLLSYTTVAAVPEADTWAMMMLGLGFMGFVARRKQV